MKLVCTQNEALEATFKEAVLNPGGKGLFAPKTLPEFKGYEYKNLNYKEFALKLIESFEFEDLKLFEKALLAYESFDDKTCPIFLRKLNEKIYINELFHGPTRAFKDMALQPFGVILSEFAKDFEDKNLLIMCATSGDTGPATLKALENVPKIKAICIYPKGGTSKIQELQMTSIKAENIKVFAIKGDFDEAQKSLKNLLKDEEFKAKLKSKNYLLSAANSVNFARILFQIIYHYYACVKLDEELDIIIPSGNFGDALGAYYAKKMGAKIKKIKIASNANSILTDFFNTGKYDLRGRKLIKTIAPAMDILLSSNIERLIFDKFGSTRTKELYESLENQGFFELSRDELALLQEDFEAKYCTDEEAKAFIKTYSNEELIDPHTATCFKFINENVKNLQLITSTAQWLKFVPAVYEALKNEPCTDEKEGFSELAKVYQKDIKSEIAGLFESEENKGQIYASDELKSAILEWL